MPVADPKGAQCGGECRGVGEGMTPRAGRRGEHGVEVDEDGAGEVRLGVGDPARGGRRERPTHVGDSQARVVEEGCQVGRRDQAHGPSIASGAGPGAVAGEEAVRRRAAAPSCYSSARRGLGRPARLAPPRRAPTFRRSSVVERATVNRLVVGSNPTAGATFPSRIEAGGDSIVRRVVSGRNKADVREKLAKLRKDLDSGVGIRSGGPRTLAAYASAWLPALRPRVRPATWIAHERYLRLHILPALGASLLAQLTPTSVEARPRGPVPRDARRHGQPGLGR